MTANTTTTTQIATMPDWSTWSRDDLLDLYRKIRRALDQTQDILLLPNNDNVVAVRLTMDQKRDLETLAFLTHQTRSDQVRTAVHQYIQRNQHVLSTTGGITPSCP